MTREAMWARRIAEAMAQPEMTTPQATDATRNPRSAADVRHSRESRGALLLVRTLASADLSPVVYVQPKSVAGTPNTSSLGTPPSMEP